MKRRAFIAGLGATAAWPLVARAQQSAVPVVGFLSSRSPNESAAVAAAFRQGVKLEIKAAQEAAGKFGLDLQVIDASTDQEIGAAFAHLVERHIGAVIVAGEPFFDSRRGAIVELAAKDAIPASYSWRENVAIGGLLSYGTPINESYRNSGVYCGRILKGERPSDLPVMQPTKFEMTINLKTAKALGLNVPPTLLTAADEVIE